MSDAALMRLAGAIAAGDEAGVAGMLAQEPLLARTPLRHGASRQAGQAYYFEEIGHHAYAGGTALHVAAAAHRHEIARRLLALGADVRSANRRGGEPLHYAADGMPVAHTWDPAAQAATIACLIEAGADPNAADKGGATPLHRAARASCAAAVQALLEGGADPRRMNRHGSTPLLLATQNTGRGGFGSPQAKAQRSLIADLLQGALGRKP